MQKERLSPVIVLCLLPFSKMTLGMHRYMQLQSTLRDMHKKKNVGKTYVIKVACCNLIAI